MCGIDLDPQLIVIVFFHPRTAGFDILLGKAFIVLYLSGMLLSHIIEDWPISIWKVTVSAATQKKRQIIDPHTPPSPLVVNSLAQSVAVALDRPGEVSESASVSRASLLSEPSALPLGCSHRDRCVPIETDALGTGHRVNGEGEQRRREKSGGWNEGENE